MKLRIELNIPAERYIALYSGQAKTIYAVAEGGLSVQFPGSALQKHVTHEGVSGLFDLHFDRNHKLLEVSRVH